jgi:hypothetical protein
MKDTVWAVLWFGVGFLNGSFGLYRWLIWRHKKRLRQNCSMYQQRGPKNFSQWLDQFR